MLLAVRNTVEVPTLPVESTHHDQALLDLRGDSAAQPEVLPWQVTKVAEPGVASVVLTAAVTPEAVLAPARALVIVVLPVQMAE